MVPPTKRHLNGVSPREDHVAHHWMLTWLVALWFYRGSRPVLLRDPIFLWFFRGGVGPGVTLDPLSPSLDRHMHISVEISRWCKRQFIANYRKVPFSNLSQYLAINYSPAAIIRNAKIWNIILLLAIFQKWKSNLDLEYPAVSEENCLKNLLPLPWHIISWEFWHF